MILPAFRPLPWIPAIPPGVASTLPHPIGRPWQGPQGNHEGIDVMHLPFRERARNIGREDRLVRGCVALSLLLLGGFAVLTAGTFSPLVVGFALGAGYFTLTAAAAWDPFYARLDIDTRPEVPHEVDLLIDADPFARAEPGRWPAAPSADPSRPVSVVDLTDSRAAAHGSAPTSRATAEA